MEILGTPDRAGATPADHRPEPVPTGDKPNIRLCLSHIDLRRHDIANAGTPQRGAFPGATSSDPTGLIARCVTVA
jgi:hypothetical protein